MLPNTDMLPSAGPNAGGAPAPAAPAPEPRRLTADEQQASPEEQALYNRFVAKAFELTYDKSFLPKVVDMLEGAGDPIEGLARASSTIIGRVMNAAAEAGEQLPGDVLFHGAKEVFEDLAELSRRAGIKDFSQDQDALEGAFFRALDHFRLLLEGQGGIDREAAQADLAMLQQMDQAGELEGMFRDLAARDDAPPPAGGEPTEGEGAPPAPASPPPTARGLMPRGTR